MSDSSFKREDLVEHWLKASAQLKYFTQMERTLRTQLCDAFEISKMKEGTNHRSIDGYMVSINRRFNYTLDEDTLDEIWDDLSEEEKECIKTKRSLSKSKYNSIYDNSTLEDAVVVKDALPTVSVTKIED